MARSFASASTQHLLTSAAVVTAPPVTMACWFIADDTTAERCLMSISDGATDNQWFRLDLRGDVGGDPVSMRCRFSGGQDARADSTTGFSTATWSHACGVVASTTSRSVYLNGGNSATNTTSVSTGSFTTTTIGKRSSSNQALMNGDIAEAGIWNVALNADEIMALSKGVCPLLIRPANLKGYWRLGIGSPEPDWSGNGNHMTVTGATVADHAPVQPLILGRSGIPFTYVAAPVVAATVEEVALLRRMRGFGQ